MTSILVVSNIFLIISIVCCFKYINKFTTNSIKNFNDITRELSSIKNNINRLDTFIGESNYSKIDNDVKRMKTIIKTRSAEFKSATKRINDINIRFNEILEQINKTK